MNTITLRRVSARGYTTRFLTWLANLPLRLASTFINLIHRLLAYVLPSRKTALRLVFYQLFILGWLMAAALWHSQYVVTCSAGGHFVTREQCGELADAKSDSQELARQAFVLQNQDILK